MNGMETANKYAGNMLLLMPEMGAWASTWWTGRWGFISQRWELCTPFSSNGKQVMCSDAPEPLGWLPLPNHDHQNTSERSE